MTQTALNVTGVEFNSDLIERIKFLLNGNITEFEFQILIKSKESQQEMRRRIDESIENIERKANLVEFSPEEYEELTQKLAQR